ncbi:MAG TPA: putative oxidoreductase C-terminal domain-containing protein [Candidatus Sulfopaludibacter sp.]|nr:putative oxidoreductase C-terminal domain-containing protein [Candidatus Sulfopaludibacter sp.]
MSHRFGLITLDPGHFHAALIQKEMYPGVSPRVAVYAPLGPDLTEHLNRIARFNLRGQSPTAWELDVHTGSDFLDRMLAEKPGNIVVLSGRNRGKVGLIRASVEAGLNVLADKPWIIRPEDLAELEQTLAAAQSRGVVAYDIMTERYEITSILQRELVNDPAVFGTPQDVYMESVHHILKLVAGVPNLRPVWFFDVLQQGEALADVGTHLVDLAQWTLFPEQAIDYRSEIQMLAARRWPTPLTAAQFQQVTGQSGGPMDYYCNTSVSYTLRGVPVKLDVLWNWEPPAGTGDTHLAIYRGSRSSIEVRQGKEENYQPELYVAGGDAAAVRSRVETLSKQYPGIGVEDQGARLHITIPAHYRNGHEAHFAQVTRQYFEYLNEPATLPAWENANMLAKYYVSTQGVAMSQG